LKPPLPSLLVITDRKRAPLRLEAMGEAIFAGGCRWMSLREYDLPPSERLRLLYRLVTVGERWRAMVSIHHDYDAALTAGAKGVHLPRDGAIQEARHFLGETAVIGSSAHDRNEAQRAVALGADYVTLSPIFASRSKPGYGPTLGLDELAAIAKTLPIPIYALGGVDASNAAQCLAAGAAGVAVMGAAMRSADPESAIRAIMSALGDGLVTAPAGGHSR
jgi:thiamine-phosphate pyrophosphorylase